MQDFSDGKLFISENFSIYMIAGWIVIGLAVLIFLVAIFRSQNLIFFSSVALKYFLVTLAIGVALFFAFSFYHIYDVNDSNLKSFSGVVEFSGHYFSWLAGAFNKVGDITGYAVQQDWFEQNLTNSSK